jgi:hypothetical protein
MIMLEEDEILDQQRSLIRLFENELMTIAVQRVLQDYCSPPEMLSSCRFQLGWHVSGFRD